MLWREGVDGQRLRWNRYRARRWTENPLKTLCTEIDDGQRLRWNRYRASSTMDRESDEISTELCSLLHADLASSLYYKERCHHHWSLLLPNRVWGMRTICGGVRFYSYDYNICFRILYIRMHSLGRSASPRNSDALFSKRRTYRSWLL